MTIPDREAREAVMPALNALRSHQEQLDEDGIMVGVSRQALEEVFEFIDRALLTAQPDTASEDVVERAKQIISENVYSAGGLVSGQELAAEALASASLLRQPDNRVAGEDWRYRELLAALRNIRDDLRIAEATGKQEDWDELHSIIDRADKLILPKHENNPPTAPSQPSDREVVEAKNPVEQIAYAICDALPNGPSCLRFEADRGPCTKNNCRCMEAAHSLVDAGFLEPHISKHLVQRG